jgi:hypothetical protein
MPVVDKNKLLRQTNETMHTIPIDPDDPDAVMEVWIRDISFFDIQRATQELFDIGGGGELSLNLEAYWRFAFTSWIVKTNPTLSTDEILNLKGDVGNAISSLLPSPDELAQTVQGGFTKGDSA